MTAINLGQVYNLDNFTDQVALSTSPQGTRLVDEHNRVWERVLGGFKITVGAGSFADTKLMKVIAIPGVEPVVGSGEL